MLDLSSANRDGFEDADGQLDTSNSLFIFYRKESDLHGNVKYQRAINKSKHFIF